MKSFSDQIVVITGAGKGIGKACAEAFASEGAKVAIISRTLSELNAVAKAISEKYSSSKVLVFSGDISCEEILKPFFEKVERELGSPTILVNNAAVVKPGLVTQMSVADWDEVMRVNLRGTFLCSREFLRICERTKQGGCIVNISSLAGIRGTAKFPGFAAYSASKYGVIGLTEVLAVEGKPLGVRVNCIAPGAVDTELLRSVAPHLKTETMASDIAQSVLFLSDEIRSAKISGSVLELFSNS